MTENGPEGQSATTDILDGELGEVLESEQQADAQLGGAMIPLSPPVRTSGLWQRLSTTRAGQRAKAFVDSTSNEPTLARLDEIREQQYTQMAELDRHLDRIEAAGSPAAQRLDEIAAELRTRLDRLGDPNQAVLSLLESQKGQLEADAGLLRTRLESFENRLEEIWEVEEQLSQSAEMRERIEAIAAQQDATSEATQALRRGLQWVTLLLVLMAGGLGGLAYALLAP